MALLSVSLSLLYVPSITPPLPSGAQGRRQAIQSKFSNSALGPVNILYDLGLSADISPDYIQPHQPNRLCVVSFTVNPGAGCQTA